MWRTTLVPILLVVFLTSQSFSAIFWYFQNKSYIDDYTKSRKASFHRGLFFTYSTAQKKLLCEDHFSAQLYIVSGSRNLGGRANELITDGQETDAESQYDLIVSEISLTGDENGEVVKKDEIFIKCFGTQFRRRIPYTLGQYFISYGFQYGRWLASAGLIVRDSKHIVLGHNMGISPEYVPMERIILEQQYVTSREIIETLRDESPAYVSLIEARDDFSSMTIWQRAVLCASLLSSPIYREERLEYSSKRIINAINDFVYSEEPLSFSYHNEKGKKSLICDCFICKGFANGDDIKSKSTNLYITRSYDDQSSVYLLKSNVESVYLDKYFKKISVLTIAKNLFKNYSERTSLEFNYDD